MSTSSSCLAGSSSEPGKRSTPVSISFTGNGKVFNGKVLQCTDFFLGTFTETIINKRKLCHHPPFFPPHFKILSFLFLPHSISSPLSTLHLNLFFSPSFPSSSPFNFLLLLSSPPSASSFIINTEDAQSLLDTNTYSPSAQTKRPFSFPTALSTSLLDRRNGAPSEPCPPSPTRWHLLCQL